MTGVRTQMSDSVGLIELNEPDSRNALSAAIRAGILDALSGFADSGVLAVVITGLGSAFCAGGDLKAMPKDAASGQAFIRDVMEWFDAVARCPLPIIAAVNGAAMGGGAELTLACDLVVAADSAIFGFPETQVGLMAPYAAARLPGLITHARAMELTLTGRVLSAAEAAEFGLVNRIVPGEELLAAAYELAGRIAQRSVLASRITKELMNSDVRLTPERAAQASAPLFADPDTKARIQAFADRRTRTTSNLRTTITSGEQS
jgi:enoyl-CoA hydratase/carnithine racemase